MNNFHTSLRDSSLGLSSELAFTTLRFFFAGAIRFRKTRAAKIFFNSLTAILLISSCSTTTRWNANARKKAFSI